MWVLFDQPEYRQDLRQWLRIGQEGFFMAGAERIAQFTVLDLLGLPGELGQAFVVADPRAS